jgi:hypothetical protein
MFAFRDFGLHGTAVAQPPARAGLLVTAMQGLALVAHGNDHPIGRAAAPIDQVVLTLKGCDGWDTGMLKHGV